MSLKKILTIGYEGADQCDFLETLRRLDVDLLLDIREMAISRRKGFAKNALREGLASVGIAYRHEPRLGSPKGVRDQLRLDGNFDRFFVDFGSYLSSQGELLHQLAGELSGTVVLLCYERDFKTCHRRAVAEALAAITGIEPRHQGVQANAYRKAVNYPRAHLGEGVPAT